MNVLIVDDNPDNCELLQRRLSRKGYRCRTVLSGQLALAQIDEQKPDLILLDVMMPVMNGWQVLDTLRIHYNSVELPILMVTAKNAHEDIISAFARGANDYIEKPVDFPILLARIEHHLRHKQLDDELRLSKQWLEESNQLLNESNRYKINFLSSMSHELRTPLNAIMGYSEILQEEMMGALNPKQKEYCKEIYDSGAYLLVIINDLLDLSKIEAGKLHIELQPTEVDLLINSISGIVQEKAQRHGIKLITQVAQNIPVMLLDPLRIKQLLINLITNAIKFTEAGKQVRLEVFFTEHGRLILRVNDQGCGISEEDLQRVFLPFEQADSPMHRRVEGTGLGLALVRQLALLHGGDVTAESALGVGSCFTVSIPRLE